MTFGLITEGPTDQVVLKYLLAGYFSNPDIDIRAVQPNIDATDRVSPGGWQRVLNYCKSPDMAAVLQVEGFVIIQMDTDCCEEFGVQKRESGKDMTNEEIVEKTKNVIIGYIGKDLFTEFNQKIIFAISHESIECWLLPLYYNDNNRTKTLNCCENLNQELQKGTFTLDCNSKQKKYYEKICRDKRDKIRNRALIETISVHNVSFNQFIQRLSSL